MGRKLKLEYQPDYEFILVGIVSFERDYRIIWEINSCLLMDFVRTIDHRLKNTRTGLEQFFSCFIYEDENTYLSYKLLSNRSETGYLIESLKNIDYLLVVTGEYSPEYSQELKSKLMSLDSVHACFILEPEKIKNCEKVL